MLTRAGSSKEKYKEGESIGHSNDSRGGRKKSMDELGADAIAKKRTAPSLSAQSTHAEAIKKNHNKKIARNERKIVARKRSLMMKH